MEKTSINDRTSLLIGEKNLKKFEDLTICVAGLGGVGSIVPISLVRSNFKKIILIDFDKVTYSNLNRQIAYNLDDVGFYKVDRIIGYLKNLNFNLDLHGFHSKIDEFFNFEILKKCDFVIDCIDDIKGKKLLIQYCLNNNINIISSLGMGNRLDPSQVKICKLNKTTDDPLARKLRYELKKDNVDISKLDVVFSGEKPIIKSNVISSMIFVPNEAGLLISSYIINYFLEE